MVESFTDHSNNSLGSGCNVTDITDMANTPQGSFNLDIIGKTFKTNVNVIRKANSFNIFSE